MSAGKNLTCALLCRDMEKERQAVPQANHIESCRECGRAGPGHARDCPHRGHDDSFGFERREQEEERYRSQREPLEGKRDRSKARSPYSPAEEDALFMDLPSGPRGQQAQPQRAEKNGLLPASYGPGEQNGTGPYQRTYPSRTNPEKPSQRKESWAKAQKAESRRSVTDQAHC